MGRNGVKVRGLASLLTALPPAPKTLPQSGNLIPDSTPSRECPVVSNRGHGHYTAYRCSHANANLAGHAVMKSSGPISAGGPFAGSPHLLSYTSLSTQNFLNLSYPTLTDTTSFLPRSLRYKSPSCLETLHLGTALAWLAWVHPHSLHALSEPPANLPVPIFPPITRRTDAPGRNSCCAQMWADY